EKSGDGQPPPGQGGSPSLRLPTTTLAGGVKGNNACPTGQKVEEAVQEQGTRLGEFGKGGDERNKGVGNLEGSTLVKRLKAASRLQNQIAGRIAGHVDRTFGRTPAAVGGEPARVLDDLADQEQASSRTVSFIMDDLHSYFERRRLMNFKTV